MRTLVLAALLAAVASWATAQKITSAPTHFSPVPHPAPSVSNATTTLNLAPFRNFHHRSNQTPFFPLGFFPDFSYPDTPPAPASESPLADPNLMLQALSALNASQLNAGQQPAKPDSKSLLIELRGGRYVSLTNVETAGNEPEPTVILRSPKPAPRDTPAVARDLQPVTLMFRDGHHEDVRDYSIANGVMYVRGNFYSDGFWNKKIELSVLNLGETVKSNDARGVRFVLPNAPNEVITRP